MKIEITEAAFHEFMHFTEYFRDLRPQYNNYLVYEVDLGEPWHLSLLLTAAKFDKHGEMESDPYQLIIAKELFVEDIKKYYKTC